MEIKAKEIKLKENDIVKLTNKEGLWVINKEGTAISLKKSPITLYKENWDENLLDTRRFIYPADMLNSCIWDIDMIIRIKNGCKIIYTRKRFDRFSVVFYEIPENPSVKE